MAVAKQWAETIQQAGTDTETEELKNWAIELLGSLADHERDKEAALVDVLSALLEKGAFHSNLQAKTLALRGQFLSHSQKYAEALNDFSEAIKLDQENALYRIRRAETFYFLERYSEASIDLEQALSIDPKSGAALGIRGRVRLQLMDYVGALQDLDAAIKLSSRPFVLHYDRGEVYRSTKRYNEALREIDIAMEIAPESKHYGYRQKAITLTAIGNHEEAVNAAQQGLKLDPTCSGCWSLLISTYKLDAFTYLEECLDAHPKYQHWARHDAAWTDLRKDTRFSLLTD